jgi:hypothetical protein
MATMFVRHTVSDYKAWRQVYDAFAPAQAAAGVTAAAVYQSAADPKDITVTHDFASLAEAQAFAESPELHEAMQKAGVVGAPTVWFANQA